MKNAVIYARHIASRQYENSIDEQIRIKTEFAKQHNLNVVGSYSDYSENKLPIYSGFEQLKIDCKKKIFDAVIIDSPFTIGRNLTIVKEFEGYLSKLGITLYYTSYEYYQVLRAVKEFLLCEVQE